MANLSICGTGSAIADYLYLNIDFQSTVFKKFMSRNAGDGGIEPGKLVLTEDFEKYTGRNVLETLNEIVGNREPDSFNIGGPATAALIHAAQLLAGNDISAAFYSALGNDDAGNRLRSILSRTPLNVDNLGEIPGTSPFTYVLSDPAYNNGAGERMFVNNIGAAWKVVPGSLGEDFFEGDIVLFGGTALVPRIHEALTSLLERAKKNGCMTVVTTVYDFPNEKKDADAPWPLGKSDSSYKYIDLLISDCEEAIRLSGESNLADAIETLVSKGLSALVVTNGKHPVSIYSDGRLFAPVRGTLPVSHAIEDARRIKSLEADTTGAGDNFAGGVLYSTAMQMQAAEKPQRAEKLLSLPEACAWGIASGDFACFFTGGTYIENYTGEKLERVSAIYRAFAAENQELLRS
jgi:sugar/nucleoside kinase (ribokinase family)